MRRAATPDEIAAILKAYGHPVVIAARYSSHDYLIGPGYYPWFWHVQRLAIGLTIAITFGFVAIRALGSDVPFAAAWKGFGGAIQAALICFGVVTALFVAAERTKFDMKWGTKWDPRTLPRDYIREPKSLFEAFFTLAADLLFILFWVKVMPFPNEIPLKTGGGVALAFSPAWEAVYWPILALAAGSAAIHLSDLIHPAWSRPRALASIIGNLAGLAVLWVLFRSQPLVEMTPVGGASGEDLDKVMTSVDLIVQIGMGVTALIWAITIGIEVWRIWRSARPAALTGGMSNLAV
jgi:hypothetical protein